MPISPVRNVVKMTLISSARDGLSEMGGFFYTDAESKD
jgi:hypothetical protein